MPYITNFERSAEKRGREEGRHEGLLAGQIITCREILGLPELSVEDISRLSAEELQEMLGELKRQVVARLQQ